VAGVGLCKRLAAREIARNMQLAHKRRGVKRAVVDVDAGLGLGRFF
jgi:hypothetical protein